MMKEKYYLGIDIGTSSVKGVMRTADGLCVKAKQSYDGEGACAWLMAVKQLISELKALSGGEISAVAVSSQVGTYIVNGKDVISWRDSVGREELEYIKATCSDDAIASEIGMRHPNLISYPLPRLLYIQKKYGSDADVVMPKEMLLRELTGETVTDVFSMRGIADPHSRRYASGTVTRLGIKIKLHKLGYPTELVGRVTEKASKEYGLALGTPVYLGCNDFFAGLLGMGIYNAGDTFDLSGTSEHVGYISEERNENGFVSGGYFAHNCTYGGTKASGIACDIAIRDYGIDGISIGQALENKAPVFLPYLAGERAPIFDENAKGVYFGLNSCVNKQDMAYSVLEGVVFSLYDIASSMGMPKPKRLVCGGGSARDKLMNELRATLFDCETVSVAENDTSALGACMLAMVGEGVYKDISSAINDCVKYLDGAKPRKEYRETLLKRFEVYKELYANLKETFKKFNKI